MPLVPPLWVLLAAMLAVGGVAGASALVRARDRRSLRALLEPLGYQAVEVPAELAAAVRAILPHPSASGISASNAWQRDGRLIARVDYVLGGASQRRNATRVVAGALRDGKLESPLVAEPSLTLIAAYERLAAPPAPPQAADDVAA